MVKNLNAQSRGVAVTTRQLPYSKRVLFDADDECVPSYATVHRAACGSHPILQQED